MSKYEPRAKELKAEAAMRNLKISWVLRKSKVFAVLKVDPPVKNTFVEAIANNSMIRFMKEFYPDFIVTSFGPSGGRFIVRDIWKDLQRDNK